MLKQTYDYFAGANAMRLGNYYVQPETLDLELAIQHFRKATTYQHSGAWLVLGRAYENSNKIEHAAASYLLLERPLIVLVRLHSNDLLLMQMLILLQFITKVCYLSREKIGQ